MTVEPVEDTATPNYRRVYRMGDTIFLYDFIGRSWDYMEEEVVPVGITDIDFNAALQAAIDEGHEVINLRINSPGGSTMHARGIMSAIERCAKPVHTYNDGTAASAAAAIWLMGNERFMAKSAVFMLHVASDYCEGHARDMRECADRLDKITSVMALAIASATGKPLEDVNAAYFDDYSDHFLNFNDCVAEGLLSSADGYDSAAAKVNTDPQALLRFVTGAMSASNQPPQVSLLQRNVATLERVRAMQNTSKPAPAGESLTTHQSLTEMTLDELRASLTDGSLTADAVQQLLTELAPPPAEPPAPVADPVATLRADYDARLAALTTEMNALRATVGGLPGAGRSNPPMPGTDPAAGGAPTDAKAQLEAFNRQVAEQAAAQARGSAI